MLIVKAHVETTSIILKVKVCRVQPNSRRSLCIPCNQGENNSFGVMLQVLAAFMIHDYVTCVISHLNILNVMLCSQ